MKRLLGHAILLVAALMGPVAGARAQGPSITLGVDREAVRRLMGAPDVIERLTQLNAEVWSYPLGSVRFDPRTGQVIGWDDPRGRLPADPEPRGLRTQAVDIALGSSGTDVVRLAGPPRQVRRMRDMDQWGYPGAVVALSVSSGRVVGWRDPDRRLPTRRGQDREALFALGGGRGGREGRPVDRPRLFVTAALRDTTPDGRSPGSSNALVVTIENAGPGTAFSVAGSVRVRSGEAQVAAAGAPASSLAAGQRLTREYPLTIGAAPGDSTLEFEVVATDANGADETGMVRLPVRLVATPRPQLVVDQARLDDQSGDGRLSPREIGEVEVVLRHTGSGRTSGLNAQLSLGRDLFAVAGTPPRFPLPAMEPGGTSRLRFSLYTTTRAESATVTLVVSDASGRYRQQLPVPLRLERSAFGPVAGGSAAAMQADVDINGAFTTRAPLNDRALAVVFGIDRYRSLPPARFAARDALSMQRHLGALFGVPDDAEHMFVRADADASGAEFRKVLGATGWLARRATEQSDIVIYYAGHGVATSDGQPMLLPWDADANYARETGIPLSEVYEALARIPARTITIILDACFTGLTRSGAPLVEGTRPIVLSVEHPALLRDGMTLFAAGQGPQSAGDLPLQRHGLFSYWMMRGLRGEADANGDARLTIGELESFATREVSRGAARQDREQRPLVIARDTSRVLLRLPER